MTVYCATTNPGKLREFARIATGLGATDVNVEILPGLEAIPAPEETGVTFQENAILKAEYYSRLAPGKTVFADDSGIAVDALNGAPGVYSARYAGPFATNEENNTRLLADMAGKPNRAARFVCAIAVARDGQTLACFEETVEGTLLTEPRGTNGFGYDPLFYYSPFACSFGEAPAERKLEVSHRGKAIAQMIRWAVTKG